jgi:hypothetical protein
VQVAQPFVAALALTVASVSGNSLAAQAPARDVVVVSGKLAHHFFTNDLFRIDTLWMQVAPDTLFHRWLSQGINGPASIVVTTAPEKFGDRPNVRILSGKLMHGTAPGESPIVHIIYVVDDQTGTAGAVTFETDDLATAVKFDAFDDRAISIVIEIR